MYLLIYHLEPKLTFNAVQIILANTRTGIRMYTVEVNIQLSQGIAYCSNKCIREVVSFTPTYCIYGLSRNTTVKELLKLVHICQSYPI